MTIDVLTGLHDNIVTTVLPKTLCIGLSIVRLDDGAIPGLKGGTIDSLTGIAVVLSVDMLTAMSMLELVTVGITSEVI